MIIGIGGFLYIMFITVAWVLTIYTLNFYYLSYQSRHNVSHEKRQLRRTEVNDDLLPTVTVQLPLYNEKYVASRLIKAVCNMDYPKDKLEIQILDDSDDETVQIIKNLVEKYRSQGFNLIHIRRDVKRSGYKAGALRDGMKSATGELIAIFDADFIPPFWFLKKTVGHFSDPDVGLVQCRWGHINENYSVLTGAQALSLDLHFLIEQKAKSLNHLFMNFNGTAGMWRTSCIKDAGGWHTSTLVEDLDLSYRAQMKGWKSLLLEDIVVQAELPVQMNAAKRQQYRWAKGSMQVANKLLSNVILQRTVPLETKIQAFIQLTRHVVHPLFLIQFLIFPILLSLHYKVYSFSLAPLAGVVIYILIGPATYLYIISNLWPDRWQEKAKQYLYLIFFATGISVNNTIAILDAVAGGTNEFLRTPKFGIVKKGESWKNNEYALPFNKTSLLEVFFGLYGCISIFIAILTGNAVFAPIMIIQTFGFIYIAFFSMAHSSFLNNKCIIQHRNDHTIASEALSFVENRPDKYIESLSSVHKRYQVEPTEKNIKTPEIPRQSKTMLNRTPQTYYDNCNDNNPGNAPAMTASSQRLILFGVLGFLVFGALLALYGYEQTIYPIDKAIGYLSRAESAQTPQAVSGYLQSAQHLLPSNGNPVWSFPNPRTDFVLLQDELNAMVLRTKYISSVEPNSAAYNTGLEDLHESIRIVETNLQEATPYLYLSITNIIISSIWISVIILIFALLKRGSSKLKEYERT
jgi:cellulose synthase/poly-beta-1,6-N-acetylglucosamine synthase-like glycosyltransferase